MKPGCPKPRAWGGGQGLGCVTLFWVKLPGLCAALPAVCSGSAPSSVSQERSGKGMAVDRKCWWGVVVVPSHARQAAT